MAMFYNKRGKVYTIAEMSANHAGSYENALNIVRAAKDAGADCLKIQTYTADVMTLDCDSKYFRIEGGLWDGYALYDLYKEASTPWEWQQGIKNECDRIGIDFLSTPFDASSADFLEDLGVEAYKIASFELVDIPLIHHVAKKGKPMLVSTGMGSMGEIEDAVNAMLSEGLTKDKIILLKCTSEYPAEFSNMNLSTITDMQKRFGVRVGLSDHSIGVLAPIAAVVLGACVIEKHFCLSRSIKNPDSDFSTEPEEFAEMVKAVNNAAAVIGSAFYGAQGREKESVVFRRSIFASADIAEGEVFTVENIRVIRPGYGLAPKYYNTILGKQSKQAYKYGEPLCEEDAHV
jgi:pseudaminic acid synthase